MVTPIPTIAPVDRPVGSGSGGEGFEGSGVELRELVVEGVVIVCVAERALVGAMGNGGCDTRVVVEGCDWPGRVGDGELSVMTARTLQ